MCLAVCASMTAKSSRFAERLVRDADGVPLRPRSIPASPRGATAVRPTIRFSGADLEGRRGKEEAMNRWALRLVMAVALAWAVDGPSLTGAQPQTPAAVAPAPGQAVGLPRARDYQAIPELRDIYFDFGAATIRPDDVKVLDANAAWLRAHPGYLVLVEGHCDSRGVAPSKREFNLDLGERRAQAAMNHLIAQGIHPSRITTLSYGEERPQCAEQRERCWQENRRSRFLVKPR
jgi:peptidoglycan-associated lipoprotein